MRERIEHKIRLIIRRWKSGFNSKSMFVLHASVYLFHTFYSNWRRTNDWDLTILVLKVFRENNSKCFDILECAFKDRTNSLLSEQADIYTHVHTNKRQIHTHLTK